LIGLLALAQAGCSLTGLADFDIPACVPSECEALNAGRTDVTPCFRYHCAADDLCRLQPIDLDGDRHAPASCAGSEGCGSMLPCDDCDDTAAAAFPGQPEVCDGADNDCNLIVDDVASGGSAENPVAVVTDTGAVTWHAYGAPLAGEAVAPVAFGGTEGAFNVVEREADTAALPLGLLSGNVTGLADATTMVGCPTDRITVPSGPTSAVGAGGPCTAHAECDNGVLCDGYELCDPSAPSADAMGCTSGDDNEAPCPGDQCNEHLGICELGNLGVSRGCSFADLDTAELRPGMWFGAMAERTGCGNVLRVGYFEEVMGAATGSPGRNLLFRGTVHRSTSFRGVDRVHTDGGACTGRSRADGEPLGAVLPSIAALPQNVMHGRRRPQALVASLVPAATGGKPVELIGIWNEQFSGVEWVNASNDGIPQRLESAAVGDVRPIVLAFEGTSASTAGYIVAYGVAGGDIAVRFVRPLADPEEVIMVDPYTTPIAAGATAQRTSEPLMALGTEQLLETDGDASGVSLVIGRVGADSAQLGLAWRDAQGLRFRALVLDPEAGTFDDSAAVQQVASGAADELALGYTPDAVVLPGFERGGATADEASTGGYLLAWRAGTTTRGARIAELDGELIGGVAELGGDLRRLHVYVGSVENDAGSQRSVPRLMHHDAGAEEFRVQAFCGPAS
jgi:hypothetical protein